MERHKHPFVGDWVYIAKTTASTRSRKNVKHNMKSSNTLLAIKYHDLLVIFFYAAIEGTYMYMYYQSSNVLDYSIKKLYKI